MIKELHRGTRLLQSQYDEANASNAKYHKENKRLEAENAELAAALLNAKNSTKNNNDHDDSMDIWLNGGQKTTTTMSSTAAANKANEAEAYRKEWLMMKEEVEGKNRIIEDQKRTIQALQDEPISRKSIVGGRMTEYTRDSNIVQSILSDRDAHIAKTEQYAKANYELRETSTRLRERNAEVVSQLTQKKKEIIKVHETMDDLTTTLHEVKQQLRSSLIESEQLRKERDSLANEIRSTNDHNTDELLESLHELRSETQALNEERIAVVIQVLAHADGLDEQLREKLGIIEELEHKLENARRFGNEQVDEEVEQMESELRAKDELISQLEHRLHETESQDLDIHTLEKQFVVLNDAMKRKDLCLKQVEEELAETLLKAQEAKARYEDDLKEMNIEFRNILQSTRERDVRITTLEDDNEAQRDAFDRERKIYADEIRELAGKLQEVEDLMQHKDAMLQELESHSINSRQMETYQAGIIELKKQMAEREEIYQVRVKELSDRMKDAEELIQQERRAATEAMRNKEKVHASQKLHIESLQKRITLLNALSNQNSRSPEIKSVTTKHGHLKGGSNMSSLGNTADQAKVAMKIQLMEKLIEELQNDVESRERDLDSIGSENQSLELALARTTEENEHLRDLREKLEKKLARRDNQITRSMERYENVNVRKEAIEAVLLRQATEGFDSALLRKEMSELDH
ncbi:hypothetical protein J3Q64DRAFT_1731706 [Phycomyces blakesleeanus]|uniref:Uncharacterized protein n=1 Tax=Phycomyces blakesleeanus TaxID=4837 RepID=A0ABR3B403_PHYBL